MVIAANICGIASRVARLLFCTTRLFGGLK